MTDDKKLLHKGSLISLYKERVDLSLEKHTHFDIVTHPGGSVIVAINSDGKACILKQWRHAVKQHVWEFPAGCIEPNEAPLEAAKRELEEESGVIAKNWRSLGDILATPGYSNEVLHLFCAKELSEGTARLDEAEELDVFWMPLADIYKMAKNGEITDAKTMAALIRLSPYENIDE